MTGTKPWNEQRAEEIIRAHKDMDGPALPILNALQEEFGCVPEGAVPLVAAALNITRAEVHGVVSFYHDYRREPHGRHVLKLCRAEACQSMGSDGLADRARKRLGVDWNGTSRDVTLEPVFCLGLCACAPAAMLDGRPVGRLDVKRLDALLDEAVR